MDIFIKILIAISSQFQKKSEEEKKDFIEASLELFFEKLIEKVLSKEKYSHLKNDLLEKQNKYNNTEDLMNTFKSFMSRIDESDRLALVKETITESVSEIMKILKDSNIISDDQRSVIWTTYQELERSGDLAKSIKNIKNSKPEDVLNKIIE
jgi:hypothetical protein